MKKSEIKTYLQKKFPQSKIKNTQLDKIIKLEKDNPDLNIKTFLSRLTSFIKWDKKNVISDQYINSLIRSVQKKDPSALSPNKKEFFINQKGLWKPKEKKAPKPKKEKIKVGIKPTYYKIIKKKKPKELAIPTSFEELTRKPEVRRCPSCDKIVVIERKVDPKTGEAFLDMSDLFCSKKCKDAFESIKSTKYMGFGA